MNRRVLLSICLAIAMGIASIAFAQGTGTGSGTGSGSTGTGNPSTGAGNTGGTTGRGSTTTPPNQQQPQFDPRNDPFSNAREGISGRLIPNPGQRVMIDLYQDGMRLDSAFSDADGGFKFPRMFGNRRYEIRIQLGPDLEFREEVDFQGGYPAMVHLSNTRSFHSTNAASK